MKPATNSTLTRISIVCGIAIIVEMLFVAVEISGPPAHESRLAMAVVHFAFLGP